MDASSIGGSEEATLDSFAYVAIMMVNGFKVKKAALAGVAFFHQNHLYSYQFSLVAEHVDEACMWDLHKVLVVPFSDGDFLLPFGIFPNDQSPDALFHQDINQATALCVQIVVNLAIALVGEAIKTPTGPTFAQFALPFGALLVVVLVD